MPAQRAPPAVPVPRAVQLFRPNRVMGLNESNPVRTQLKATADPEEFTTFMRAHQDMVFSTAARLVGRDAQAEDVAQEVFVRAFERFDDLRSSPTAGGWLKTVATNLAINHLNRYRKRWRLFADFRSVDDEEAGGAPPDPPVPDTMAADLDGEQRRAAIEAALSRLPVHQRIPLVLYHFEDCSYEEIAARLGVSLSKVKTDIRRGRAALAPVLRACGIVTGAPEE